MAGCEQSELLAAPLVSPAEGADSFLTGAV